MIEDRRNLREQTPRRGLDKINYRPRRLVKSDKIDSVPHEIYPIPEDGERKTSHHQSSSGSQENSHRKDIMDQIKVQTHPLTEVMVQVVVPGLQE